MKIGMYTETYVPTPDGVAHYVASFKRQLEKKGHEVHVFTCGERYEDIENGTVHKAYSRIVPFYKQYRAAVPIKFLHSAEKYGFDVVHMHTPFGMGTIGYLSARKAGVPTVCTLHTYFLGMCQVFSGILSSERLVKLAWLYNLKLYQNCDATSAPTAQIRDMMYKDWNYPKEVKVVWNGTDTDVFRIGRHDADVRKEWNLTSKEIVTYVGRLTPDKGVHTYIDAVNILQKKGYDIQMVIAGIGPYREALLDQIDRLGMKDSVRFFGYLDEAHKASLLSASNIFSLPSKADTFGISMLEAMAAGCPTIGANSGGIPEVIKDNENGLLFEFGDKDQLAEKMQSIFDDNALRQRLIKDGRKFVEDKCSMSASADGFLRIYEEIIEKRKAKSG